MKRIASDHLDVDVFAHSLDNLLHDVGPTLDGVQVEVADDALESRAAQDLLSDRLHPLLDAGGH